MSYFLGKTKKTKKEPLSYLDVIEREPFCAKVGEWRLVINLWSAPVLLDFVGQYKTILKKLELIESNNTDKGKALKYHLYQQLALLLFEKSKGEYGVFERRKYKKFLIRYYMDHFDVLVEHYDALISHQTDLKKKLSSLQSFDIWGSSTSWTVGGKPLSELIKTRGNGIMYGIPRRSLSSSIN